jgi:siderophore synthetase component
MGRRVSALLRQIFERDQGFAGRADLLGETLGAHLVPEREQPELAQHFSFLARESVSRRTAPGDFAVPAAALPIPFEGEPLLVLLAGRDSSESQSGPELFTSYALAFLRVILRSYLVYGVALEAHGQNTLACFDASGRLRKFLFRDLAGIRIHEPTLLRLGLDLEVHPDRRTVVAHFEDHRFWLQHRAYHLHLGHLAHGLAHAGGQREGDYWRLLGDVTDQVFDELRADTPAKRWARERAVLLDDPWNAKASLRMRLLNRTRDIGFTARNPLRGW